MRPPRTTAITEPVPKLTFIAGRAAPDFFVLVVVVEVELEPEVDVEVLLLVVVWVELLLPLCDARVIVDVRLAGSEKVVVAYFAQRLLKAV